MVRVGQGIHPFQYIRHGQDSRGVWHGHSLERNGICVCVKTYKDAFNDDNWARDSSIQIYRTWSRVVWYDMVHGMYVCIDLGLNKSEICPFRL